MKELCIDARMAFNSGIGTYIRNILPYFKSAFPVLRIIAPPSMVEKWTDLGSYDLIPTHAPLYSIQEQLEMPLRIPKCDLYWTPHYNIPVFPIRAKKRVVTIHDVYHLAFIKSLSLPKQFYAKTMIKRATLCSDRIITGSQFSLDEIVKYTHVSPNKISMIHDGVNLSHFSRDISGLREKYILFVSTLAPHKNLTRLLRAWKRVGERFPDWDLVLAGKQVKNVDYLKVFDEFPELQHRVRFAGQVQHDELQKLYSGASGLIAPSLYEGFGLTPLEAMAAGCPTIVSKAASLPEVCGDASLYVDPYDEVDMAEKICSLIDDQGLREQLIEKGTERVKIFSWEKTAKKHIEVMERLLLAQ